MTGRIVIGRITEIGSDVTRFEVGEVVGVGCMIDSCQQCDPCQEGEEQHCQGEHGPTMTYNGYFKPNGSKFNTFGGYSTHIVAKENFLLDIPESLDITAAAPILCAGVTTWTPWKGIGLELWVSGA
jgi:alcohol dehydrogenase (NADP+)